MMMMLLHTVNNNAIQWGRPPPAHSYSRRANNWTSAAKFGQIPTPLSPTCEINTSGNLRFSVNQFQVVTRWHCRVEDDDDYGIPEEVHQGSSSTQIYHLPWLHYAGVVIGIENPLNSHFLPFCKTEQELDSPPQYLLRHSISDNNWIYV